MSMLPFQQYSLFRKLRKFCEVFVTICHNLSGQEISCPDAVLLDYWPSMVPPRWMKMPELEPTLPT